MHVLTRQQSSTAYGVSQGHPSSSHARTSLPSPRGRTRTAPSRQEFLYTSVGCTILRLRAATVTIFLSSDSAGTTISAGRSARDTEPWPALIVRPVESTCTALSELFREAKTSSMYNERRDGLKSGRGASWSPRERLGAPQMRECRVSVSPANFERASGHPRAPLAACFRACCAVLE